MTGRAARADRAPHAAGHPIHALLLLQVCTCRHDSVEIHGWAGLASAMLCCAVQGRAASVSKLRAFSLFASFGSILDLNMGEMQALLQHQ